MFMLYINSTQIGAGGFQFLADRDDNLHHNFYLKVKPLMHPQVYIAMCMQRLLHFTKCMPTTTNCLCRRKQANTTI